MMPPLKLDKVSICPTCGIRPVNDSAAECDSCRYRAAARASRDRQRQEPSGSVVSPISYLTPVKMRGKE